MAILVATMNPMSKSKLSKVGIDPGRLNLKVWLARIDFAKNGHRLIEHSYQKVGHPVFRYSIPQLIVTASPIVQRCKLHSANDDDRSSRARPKVPC